MCKFCSLHRVVIEMLSVDTDFINHVRKEKESEEEATDSEELDQKLKKLESLLDDV